MNIIVFLFLLDMLSQGATALAESWDFDINDSHIHAMFGHIEEWFYEYLGGINFAHDSILPTTILHLSHF